MAPLVGGAVVDHLSIASTMQLGGVLAVLSMLVVLTFGTRHASLKDVLGK
jgi:predicted MFS family arabinose efflux permease